MRKWLMLAAVLTASAATAQPVETVIVEGGTWAGIWKIARPSYVEKNGLFGALHWGPLRDVYCRFEQVRDALTVHCLPEMMAGTVTVDGAHIHLAWGTMMLRIALDGALQSPARFDANFAIKLAGISFEDSDKGAGVKLSLATDGPDPEKKSALLRTIITDGLAPVPHDARTIRPPDSGDIPKANTLQSIIYLGQMTWDRGGGREPRKSDPNYFAVYAVEFEDGERLCGLHQREDGVLDAFACV